MSVNLKHSCEIVSFPAGWQTKPSPFVLACYLHSLEIEASQILATLIGKENGLASYQLNEEKLE